MCHLVFPVRIFVLIVCFLLLAPPLLAPLGSPIVNAQLAGSLASQPWKTDAESMVLQRNWDALRERHLRLLPVPKQLAFSGKPIVLSGKGKRQVVIVLDKDSPRGQVALRELQSRMQDFSSRLATEFLVSDKKVKGAYNIVIENHWPCTFTKDESRHAEAKKTDQAYGLYPLEDGIILSGGGEIGMMYAAVTCRFLMAQTDGRVVLYPAKVIDWPDFKGRQLGQMTAPYHRFLSSPEKHLEKMKPFMDWMFRIKGNGVFRHTIGSVSFSTIPNTLPVEQKRIQASKQVNDYAMLRGIKTMHNDSVRLGTEKADKQRLGGENLLLDRYGDYHSWARHDLHEIKARNMCDLYKQSGIHSAFLHAIDAGGILDPEDWSQRDALTRSQYGDDRIQADADMYNVYVNQFNKNGLEPVLVAYPYSADNLNVNRVLEKLGMGDSPATRQRAQRFIDDLKRWMNGINDQIDKSVMICVREDTSGNLFDYYGAYAGRPMWIYWETTHFLKGIDTTIATPVRALASAFSRDRPHEDTLWISTPKHQWFDEQILCTGAEFSWNTKFPGWHDFDPVYRDSGEVEIDDQEALNILSERAAVSLWGDEAGQILRHTFNGHLSWHAAIDPTRETSGLHPRVLGSLTRQNKRAIDKACLAFEAAWKRHRSKKSKGEKLFDDHSLPFFIQHYAMARGAKTYGDMHAYDHEARRLISAGEMEKAVKLIDRGIAEVVKDESDFKKCMRLLEKEPWVYPKHATRPMVYHPELYDPDFVAIKSTLEELQRDRQKIYERLSIPSWFRPWLEKSDVKIARSKGQIKLDGVPSEQSWLNSPPINYFVGQKSFKLLREPCEVRWLHDDNAIYVSGHVYNQQIAELKARISSRGKSRFDESIGIFILPHDDTESRSSGSPAFQYIVSCSGDLAAQKTGPKGDAVSSSRFPSKAIAKVVTGNDSWTFELKIPLAELKVSVSSNWKAAVARRWSDGKRRSENFASKEFDGAKFTDHTKFAKVRFLSSPTVVKTPSPVLSLSKSSMETKTTASGRGTEVKFEVAAKTRVPIRRVTIETIIESSKTQQVYSKKTFQIPGVNLLWKSPGTVAIQLENVHQGVKVKQRMTYYNLGRSEPETVEAEVIFGDTSAFFDNSDTFGEGIGRSGGLKSIAKLDTATADQRWLHHQHGAIEFWFRPDQDITKSETSEEKALFHYGPIWKENPKFVAKNSITAGLVKNVYLTFLLSNHVFNYRKIQVRLPAWKKDTWHHLAFVWDMNQDGKAITNIYMDGKRGKGTLLGPKDGSSVPADGALETEESTFPLQIGCLRSGIFRVDGSFDNLILWDHPKYSQEFAPQAKPNVELKERMLLFPFDGDLDGNYLDAGKRKRTAGQPGY